MTSASGTDRALGVEARSSALLSAGDAAPSVSTSSRLTVLAVLVCEPTSLARICCTANGYAGERRRIDARGWLATACRTRRSPAACSSAFAPSNIT